MEEILRANKRKSCQMETVVTISMEHRLRSMKVELDSRRKKFFSTDGKKIPNFKISTCSTMDVSNSYTSI